MIFKYGIFLLLLPFVLSQNDSSSDKLVVCMIPEHLQLQALDRRKVDIYNNELLIKYNGLKADFNRDRNTINIVLNGTLIEFQAYMVETNIVSNISSAKKISWSSNGLILGAGELVKTRKERYKVKYNFSLSPNSIKRSSYLLKTVDYAIRRFVNDCLEKEIINKTESIVKENLKNVLVKNEVSSSAPSSTDNLDLNLNNLFDVLIDSAIDFIKNYNLEKIDLPNINESIEIKFLLFSITPQLETFNGTFNGLTTLKRITDSILTRENHKYIISSGFDISNIFIDMKYKLTYGNLIHKFGSMFSTAKNIAIKSKISVNYNVPRCIIDLEELKISKLTKFEIKLGGPDVAMDSLTSTIINTLTDHFNNFSRTLIENNLKDFLKNKLEFVDCEKYRTKIIG